jgi:hypothetical protein
MYKSEIKDMTYSTTKQSILYLEVNDDDTAICIIDRGGWPCSYIKMPENIYQNYVESVHWDGCYDDIDVWVHGGVTFGEYRKLMIRSEYDIDKFETDEHMPEGYWLGWDYAHLGDYCYRGLLSEVHYHSSDEKKYTIEELIEEAHEALKQLRENNFRIYSFEV